MLAWSSPGRNSVGPAHHPRVAGHEVLDRRPLGVAQVQRARDVGRRLDEHERGQVRRPRWSRRRPGRRRRPPASARRRRARTRPAHRPWPGPPAAAVASWSGSRLGSGPWVGPETKNARSSSGRTGSWYHLLVPAPGPGRSSRPVAPGASLGALTGAIRTARGRRSRPSSPRGSHRPALAPRVVSDLLFPVTAVRAGMYHAESGGRPARWLRAAPRSGPRCRRAPAPGRSGSPRGRTRACTARRHRPRRSRRPR